MFSRNRLLSSTGIGLLLVAAGLLAGAQAWSQSRLVPYMGADKILSIDAANKTVTVSLVGGQMPAASEANFNEFSSGAMVIRVPLGWTVHMALTVDSQIAHSALIVPWSQRQASSFTPAFSGSDLANYKVGIAKGAAPEEFTFTANKAGQYALVCGVPGHDVAGMWDEFDVVAGLASPEVLTAG